jgi:putative ABC transport system permease protein
VLRVEPLRSVGARVRFGHHARRLGIMGLQPGGDLFRLLDAGHRVVPLPAEGLVVSEQLAKVLGCGVGDAVTVEVLEGERPVRQVPVMGVMTDFGEPGAYMDIAALRRLLREGGTLSGAFVAADPDRLESIYRTLKETPKVAGVGVKRAALESFRKTLGENLLLMRAFNVFFASVIAFGVVYNNARISLAERSRELATLRVIGFTRAEISAILLGELAVLTCAGILPGLLLGYGLAALATRALATEVQRIPLVVDSGTFAFAAAVVLVAAFVSGLIVRRGLDHLDLVAVLKSRE